MTLKPFLRSFSLLAASVAVVTAAGTTYSTVPDQAGVIHGCYQKNSGVLRVVDGADDRLCNPNSELPISWNQRGPSGVGAQTVPIVSLSPGDERVLLYVQPFTVVAACRLGANPGEVVAELLISTNEDGSAFANAVPDVPSLASFSYQNGAFGPGGAPQLLAQLRKGAGSAFMMSVPFSAVAPSGVQLTGQLWLHENTLNANGVCSFGGTYTT